MMTFAEFFAGVGLVREGFSTDDWQCIWANDISQDKKETYVKNYGGEHFLLGDVWDIVDRYDEIPKDTFLYTASFPCTDLSVAGSRAGLAGEESGTLHALLHILEIKRKLKDSPKVVLLENVKGFLTSHDGKDIASTVKFFTKIGYFVDILELDAQDFTPQSRPRVFLIAVQNDLAPLVMKLKKKNQLLDTWWSYFDHQPELRSEKLRNIILKNDDLNWGLFDIKSAKKNTSTLQDVIESVPDNSELWWNQERQGHLFNQMSRSHQSILRGIAIGEEYSYGTVYRRMRNGRSMAELRTDGVAGCLRTPRGGSSKQILIKAGRGNWKVRLLTPREYARLQGVRDDFILPENINKGYFAMGDAVCVPVIRFLSANVITPAYKMWEKSISNKSLKTDC